MLHLAVEPRLAARSRKILDKWQPRPGLGFPDIFSNPSELEAAYRFFGNPRLNFKALLAPHTQQSIERCTRHDGDILCIHDTSAFVFSTEREGLGFINKNNRGFLGHFALAVSHAPQGAAIPFGVVSGHTWARTVSRKDKGIPQHELRSSPDCESHRWLNTVKDVQSRFAGQKSPIHVMDREGDIYDNLSAMVKDKQRFVIRAMTNRKIEAEDKAYPLLFDALDGLPMRYRETISVTPRKGSRLPDQKKAYPKRDGRTAEVCVAATEVTLLRTRHAPSNLPKTTSIYVVHVFEPSPPENESPVEWILLTNEPIGSDDDIRRVVGIYRQRWMIEEFFKAIKSGCAFEKRQLETYHRLTNVLAMTIPLAWEMLLLRTQSRENSNLKASGIMDPKRLLFLHAVSKDAKRYILPPDPTLTDVAYAIAGLGGHLKRNGPPGWQTLHRGYEKLLNMEQGWIIMSRERKDQS
jgi:hypothetical protein